MLLHASCHNPTGADLSEAQWRDVLGARKAARRSSRTSTWLIRASAPALPKMRSASRLFAAELPEVLVAVSCSKNFGLYRERTGALHIISETATAADAILTQLVRIARTIYSMPPDHGAAIVHEILANDALAQLLDGRSGRHAHAHRRPAQ